MVSRFPIKPKHRGRKILIVFACLIVVILGGYLVISQSFKLNNFIVEGCSRYSDEEIKERLVTEKTDQITFLMNLRYHFQEHKTIPFIQKYTVSMEDKHTIKVQVYEKMIIGCVELMGSYMYFDKDGIVVESSKDRIDGVPLIAGLKFDKIVLNEKLEIQKSTLYDKILSLTKLIQKFELNVDKVFINSSYEVTLYLDGNEFLLGVQDFYDEQLSAIPAIIKASEGSKLCYDMRFYNDGSKNITAKPMN